jgi:hypothetical protein
MLPIVGVPRTIQRGLLPYRKLFGRAEGFEHVSRYITGLMLSGNKTLQGIYDEQVWDGDKPSRRAMHEAVFEAGWDAEGLLPRHRAVIAPDHQGRGREVICLDWTLPHQKRGRACKLTNRALPPVRLSHDSNICSTNLTDGAGHRTHLAVWLRSLFVPPSTNRQPFLWLDEGTLCLRHHV